MRFQEKNGTYADPGGKIKKGYSVADMASQELLEETRNTVFIPGYKLKEYPNFTIYDRDRVHVYRVYFVKKEVDCMEFEKSDVSDLSKEFRETIAMGRFPLGQLNSKLKEKGVYNDAGKLQQIRPRTKKILKKAIEKEFFTMLNEMNEITFEF